MTLLRKERESKAREFAEAQELSTRLMAIMDKRSLQQNESQPLDTGKHSSGPHQELGYIPAIDEEGDTEEEQFRTQVSYQGSSNSFASSNNANASPVPKRPASFRGSKKPSSGCKDGRSTDDREKDKASSTTRSWESREPLEETNPNQSPTETVSKKDSSQSSSMPPWNSQDSKLGSQFNTYESNDESYNFSDGDLEGLEYIEDDILTSTPSM